MSGSNYERELRNILREKGWIVIRSAGSFACDLVALKPDEYEVIEVKSTKSNVFRTGSSKRDRDQFDLMNGFAKKGINASYYIRWKGKGTKWTRYQLPMDPYPIFRRSTLLKETKTLNTSQ